MQKFSLDGVTRYETKSGIPIYKIPVSTPFPVGKINVYIIDADERVMIDTGPYSEKSFAQLQEKLALIKIPLSTVKRIVITHGHMDHHGQLGRLLQHTEAKIYAHPYDKEKIEDFDRHREGAMERYHMFLINCNVSDQAIQLILANHHRFSEFCSSAAVNVDIMDGDFVTPLQMKVFHTPGHQEGSVCLLFDDILFTGDNVLKYITPNPFCKALFDHCGLDLYLDSMKRLLTLQNINGSLPGHGSEIEELHKRVNEILVHHDKRSDKIVDVCKTEKTTFEIASSPELFPKLRGGEIFLAIIEVAAHLERLVKEKRVEISEKDKVHYYRQTK